MTPIVKGAQGYTDKYPLKLPKEISWAETDPTIRTAMFFLAREAELLARAFVPKVLIVYMKSWISSWNGEKAPRGPRENWLSPEVRLVWTASTKADNRTKFKETMLGRMRP